MTTLLFEKLLNQNAKRFDESLQEPLRRVSQPDMVRYLYGPLSKYTANGGKRHRPLICEVACKAVGGTAEQARSAACAIEHFHTAALIHDDIADESLLRRGEPCMHITEGEGIAINCGDLALSLVTGTVLRDESLSDGVKLRILRELVDMTTRTIEGQALDLGWARDERFDISIDDYLIMAQHKTAFYSGAVPLAVGAIIGGGTEEQIAALRAYGMSTGLAFQIQDDLLNLVGDAKKQGKDFRSDITEGKRTLIMVHALSNATPEERDELLQILQSKTTDPNLLARAVEIADHAGSLDYARSYATKLAHEHEDLLRETLPASHAREELLSMGVFFVKRLK